MNMDNIENMAGDKIWKQKRDQLSKIHRATLAQKRGALSPVFAASLVWTVLTGLVFLGIVHAFDLGAKWESGPNPFVVGGIIGLLLSVLADWRKPESRSWIERIDSLLSSYKPIDKHAYRELQQRTRTANYLEPDCVLEWISLEKKAIDEATGNTPKQFEFLSKKL
jgi:hypothetical protein